MIDIAIQLGHGDTEIVKCEGRDGSHHYTKVSLEFRDTRDKKKVLAVI
jgi:translation initiation factor 2 gamma subunit (eIF-2gamma)